MGGNHSLLTPLPPNYIAITFRPPDELWLCQAPSHLIVFIRSLLLTIWPHNVHQEKRCNATDVKLRQLTDRSGTHPPLLNTVFRIPSGPFTAAPIHQTQAEAEAAYQFMTMLVARLYSMGYEMIASGHFVRGTEANSCIFRRNPTLPNDTASDEPTTRRESRKQMFLHKKLPKGVQLDGRKQMLAVGLEGWNKIYVVNATNEIVKDVVKEFRKTWPNAVHCWPIRESFQSERPNGKCTSTMTKSDNSMASENSSSFLIQLEGHPWDSYKEHSNITPLLVLQLIDLLERAGFDLTCCTNFRGLLDCLFFRQIPEKVPRTPVVRIAFSLCHQNCIRIYGGTSNFCAWITHLLQHLWIAGTAYEKWISLEPVNRSAEPALDGDEGIFEYSEVKLNGAPWCIPEWNRDNLLAVQYMMARFAGVLFLVGWECQTAIKLYSSPYDKCLLVFEKKLSSRHESEDLIDLEVKELNLYTQLPDSDTSPAELVELLIPVCFSTYEIDRLCILGGSKAFLEDFDTRFMRLFRTQQTPKNKNKDSLPDSSAAAANDSSSSSGELTNSEPWIVTRAPFYPELIHKVFLGDGNSPLCVFSQNCRNMALTAIAELDPENFLEYATNYRMWSANCYWPPKMFKKTKQKATKFFYRSQLPLAIMCWIHELFLTTPEYFSAQLNHGTNSGIDRDTAEDAEMIEKNGELAPRTLSDPKRIQPSAKLNEDSLVACLDCCSTVTNAPPAWVYLVKCRGERILRTDANLKKSP